jgi:hypothetical protein
MLLILLVLAVAEMFVGRAVYPNGLVGFVQIGLTDGKNQNLHTHTPLVDFRDYCGGHSPRSQPALDKKYPLVGKDCGKRVI